MTTTAQKPAARNVLGRPVRGPVRERGYPGSRDREVRSSGISRDLERSISEEPGAASPRAAFVSGMATLWTLQAIPQGF